MFAAVWLLPAAGLEWEQFEGASIPVPPPEHPRLYLRARDLPDLHRRVAHPVLKPVWDSMGRQATKNPQNRIEYDAVRYLLTGDAELGKRTIEAALELLKKADFPRDGPGTRPTGRAMVTGAIVYDWCYPLLSAGQKKAYQEQLLRLAHNLEYGYPPKKGDAITGHNSEWMTMRDLMSAGIAIYDEFPEMYRLAANRFFLYHVPARNFWYLGGAFHQGSAYAETRCSSELYPLWIFERMGAGPVYHPSQQFLPYSWIYLRRPDGQLLRSGDGQSKEPKLRSLLNASYYKDPYVLADYLRTPGIESNSQIFEFLWRDPDLQPRPVSELPLSRYMGSPYGWMVARTGWDADSVIVEMKVNVFNFNNHQHLDAGAFQIYYKGPLAVDSGLYGGKAESAYGSAHHLNYMKRTVAHNCMLVHDPAEQFTAGKRSYANDGGQKFVNDNREPASLEQLQRDYRTAVVLGQGFGPDPQKPAYTYLKGDLTRAYGGKVKQAQRSFVFLNLARGEVRAALVVFDRVVSSDPGFRKYWLLHSMEEPRIAGSAITVAPAQRGWRGQLVDRVLLPDTAEIATVGGPGREFSVFGQNFPVSVPAGPEFEPGGWRVEVSPRAASATDRFLNVMQIMDRETAELPVKRIEDENVSGLLLAGTTVLFRNDGARTDRPVRFRSEGDRFLAADLAEGTWQVWRDGAVVRPAVRVSGEEGTLWFEGPAGNYELRR